MSLTTQQMPLRVNYTIHHYRKTGGCRVPVALPCAIRRAHGKELICHVPPSPAHGKHLALGVYVLRRVLNRRAHGEVNTFAVCRGKTHGENKTHGECTLCRVPARGSRQNSDAVGHRWLPSTLCRVPTGSTRQTSHGKDGLRRVPFK